MTDLPRLTASCPGCGLELPADDLQTQKAHMERYHPEIITERLRAAGELGPDEQWSAPETYTETYKIPWHLRAHRVGHPSYACKRCWGELVWDIRCHARERWDAFMAWLPTGDTTSDRADRDE